jgi:List-Bact-rpt repeat protein
MSGRWLAVALAAALIVGAPSALGGRAALPRATADRPDDRAGAQVHAIYVLPGDGADRALDTDGTIEASVGNFQAWLKGQTGGRGLRLDTSQGQLDVSFLRLSQTDAQLAATGLFLRDAIERELRAAGFDQPGKIYALYYDGSNTAACGGGAWPPNLPGIVGGVYMRATFGAGFPCYDPTRSRSGLQLMDLAVLHELLHTLGFVATCSPHHTRAGHVSDSPSDLMWAGDAPWTPSVLDAGHDDYFEAHVPGCPDLADSSYLEATTYRLTVVVKGPGRVTGTPPGIACPRRCTAAVAAGTRMTLRALPGRRAHLASWKGACRGRARCSVTLDANRTVTATFRR